MFFGIGKRFAIFTLVNVIETSLFMRFISPNYIPLLEDIAQIISKEGGLLSRALFGGVCTGLSSALCFKVEISTGGIDIILPRLRPPATRRGAAPSHGMRSNNA